MYRHITFQCILIYTFIKYFLKLKLKSPSQRLRSYLSLITPYLWPGSSKPVASTGSLVPTGFLLLRFLGLTFGLRYLRSIRSWAVYLSTTMSTSTGRKALQEKSQHKFTDQIEHFYVVNALLVLVNVSIIW